MTLYYNLSNDELFTNYLRHDLNKVIYQLSIDYDLIRRLFSVVLKTSQILIK